jgi:beta-lactam-binding protein with PASTA domain
MKTLTILFGAAVGVAATIAVGSGVAAAAPDVVGQTYKDATNTIQQTGATVVIATKTGGMVDEAKCIVTSAWSKPSGTAIGEDPSNQVLVALNCNAAVAAPGLPGNSAASLEGRQALISQEAG